MGRPTQPALPPFWRPRLRRLAVAFCAYVTIHVGVLVTPPTWWARIGVPSHWRFVVWLPYPFILTAYIRETNRGDRTTRRRLAAGELPCWTCGYDLARSETPAPCPECGQPFDAAELRRRWARLFPDSPAPG